MKNSLVGSLNLLMVGSIGAVFGALITRRGFKEQIIRLKDNNEKMKEFYDVLVRWAKLHGSGRGIEQYLLKKNIKTVAIYGMKELGELLYDELKKSSIKVLYAIDKDAEYILSDLNVLSPSDSLQDVDAVIVTAIHYFSDIEAGMKARVSCPVISIEDVIFDAFYENY